MTPRRNDTRPWPRQIIRGIVWAVGMACALASCAKMGSPDGGWYDETPPRVVGASPEDRGTNVTSRRISIFFNEFIKIDNATENVVVSPPQLEQAEIKAGNKRILVELKDSLKPNTTYTIDFSDAISDNNEGNPLGNYTYSFSTGEQIDTMEVAGTVLEAGNLEPVKGILVGLYACTLGTDSLPQLSDTVFRTQPMLRVSRTDSRGRFVVKGIAPGTYRVYALQDADGNYQFSQKSEQLAFLDQLVVPTSRPDVRQDTIWADSLHIRSITPVKYTHFLPDDLVLRAFTEEQTDRYFLKAERKQADNFTLFFSYGHEQLPAIRGLNFDEQGAFIVESNERQDTITYWLRDTLLVNQDTLRMQLSYWATDTLGQLQQNTDTLEVLSKDTYAKRLKKQEEAYKEWKKRQERAAKRDEPTDSVMPIDRTLNAKWNTPSELDPDRNITVQFPSPLAAIDSSKIHLYSKIDTLWYRAPFEFREKEGVARTYELRGEWHPDTEYSLEIDSAAFTDIYGMATEALKKGFKVKSLDAYGTLLFTFQGMDGRPVVAQLLDKSDKPIKEVYTHNGQAEFFFVQPGTYYLRIILDENDNGQWDTGCYDEQLQPEPVYYYEKEIECKAKWDITLTWDPLARPLDHQKPGALVKQKADKNKKTIRNRNQQRAKEKGIQYVESGI